MLWVASGVCAGEASGGSFVTESRGVRILGCQTERHGPKGGHTIMWRDIRVAWRFLMRRRVSAAIGSVTLGIAIAVSTLAAGVADQAFWRGLRAEDGAELATIYNRRAEAPQFQTLSYPDYVNVTDRLEGEADVAAFVRIANTLGGGDWPTKVAGELVSDNYFAVLGARPHIGRLLQRSPNTAAFTDPVVVLGYQLWQRTFHADPSVVGRAIRLGHTMYTVIGIAPAGFHGPSYPSEFWIPLAQANQVLGQPVLERADVPLLQTVARLRPTGSPVNLQSRISGLETNGSREGWRLAVFPAAYLKFWPAYRPTIARYLALFAALALCIIVLSCANLAGLLIARASERQHEIAIRLALGASVARIGRRLAAEAVVLTILGGAVAALLTLWASAFLTRIPMPVPAPVGVTFDARLAAAGILVSLTAAVLFAALSVLPRLGSDLRAVLAASASSVIQGPAAQRVLVVAQVALGCILLAMAGLLARSAVNVDRIDPGIDIPDHVVASIGLHDQGYTATNGVRFYERLADELRRHPEVRDVAFGWNAPLTPVRSTLTVSAPPAIAPRDVRYNVVSAGYLTTLGIPLLGGREFDARDNAGSEPVAIVNETLASHFDDGAIGRVVIAADHTSRRIIGVARDIKYNGLTEPAQSFVYLPLAQAFRADMHVYLRTRGGSGAPVLREALRRIDPNVALSDVQTLSEQLREARAVPRVSALASAGGAGLAVFLALVGVYGVLTSSVDRRTRELAIRSALGASPAAIIRHVMLEGASLTLAGLLAGIIGTVAAGRFVADLLVGVAPHDPVVSVMAPALVLIASAASWIAPAVRAARIDPARVFRSE